MNKIIVGWNGLCEEHGIEAEARSTEFTAEFQWTDGRPHSFGRILAIYCPQGHTYYAISQAGLIHDPFSAEETASILKGTT